mgnify:CR=1 FL=1
MRHFKSSGIYIWIELLTEYFGKIVQEISKSSGICMTKGIGQIYDQYFWKTATNYMWHFKSSGICMNRIIEQMYFQMLPQMQSHIYCNCCAFCFCAFCEHTYTHFGNSFCLLYPQSIPSHPTLDRSQSFSFFVPQEKGLIWRLCWK